jgi:integrase
MSVYKRGEFYWYRFVWRGKEVAESTKQGNLKVAQDQERAHRLRLSNGELGLTAGRDKTVVPSLADYFAATIMPWAEVEFADTPKSFKWYRDNQRVLVAFEPLAKAPLNEIGTALAEQFKTWRKAQGVGVHTVNSSIRVLRSVLNRAARERLRAPLVKGEIVVARGAKSRERVLTPEEEAKYLAECTEPLRTVATIIVDMGFRPEEVFRIEWPCVNFTDDRIFIERGKSKAARRHVKMSARVRAMMWERWVAAEKPKAGYVFPAAKASVGHIVPNTVYAPHLAAVAASGVAPFVLYELRHTFLTRLGQSGCTPWEFAAIAGHGDVSVSKHYVHLSNEDTDSALERMHAGRTNSVQTGNRRSAKAATRLAVARRAAKS